MTGEPLALAHQQALAPLLAARWAVSEAPESTIADPWFANLYLFRHAHDWHWLRGDWPCIAGHAYDGTRLLLPLFDLASAPVDRLRPLLAGYDAFGPLSTAQAARLDQAVWHFSHAREDADYVYPADQFRHYRGDLLSKKRNLVNQLLSRHKVEATLYSSSMAHEVATIVGAWMEAKGKHAGEADDGACREALMLADQLGLEGTLYRIDDEAAGFVLAEAIRPGVMVMRFAKAKEKFKGLYQHMFQHFCQMRPDLQWLNFEQDLGHTNFRQTKLSYQPALLLAKTRATLRQPVAARPNG